MAQQAVRPGENKKKQRGSWRDLRGLGRGFQSSLQREKAQF